MKKAVISMSGGLDSTCLALFLLAEGYEIKAYAFDYGQKHSIELDNLKRNIELLQNLKQPISLQIIDLKDVFSDSNSSLKGVGEIPKEGYNETNITSTVVENRNVIFSSIVYGKALSWANKTKDDVCISLGIHAGDHAVYPDTTKESFEAAEHLFKISNIGSERVSYKAPFVSVTKAQVLSVGIASMNEMGFSDENVEEILKNTHSCYDPIDGKSCGVCATCVERLDAFEKNDYVDPIEYL